MLHDLALTAPLLILLFAAMFTLVVDPFLKADESARRFWGWFGAAFAGLALVTAALLFKFGPFEMQTPAFAYHLSASRYSLFFVALISLCTLVTHLASPKYMVEQGVSYGEYYALINFAAFGMACMVSAESLISLFISLEIMSMAIYVLVAFKRTSLASVEAGMKYFIMGAVGSALLLYGMAFIYGLSGSTTYVEISRALIKPQANGDFWLGLAMLLTGAAFMFKVAAAPFHMWAPDAYEGAPTPITGFMSSAVKAAGFAALLKFLFAAMAGPAMGELHTALPKIIATVAVLSMTVGNLLALTQKNVKRVLAYSAVAHAGYLLLGCVAWIADPTLAGYQQPTGAVPFYLVGYALASLAAFAALAAVGKNGEELTGEAQLIGMGRRHPYAGAVLALAMISLAGVPPTLGFFGKLQLVRDVLGVEDSKYLPHVVILVLNSVVSAYYYLRVTVYIYMRPEGRMPREYVRETSLDWAMGLTAAGILFIGALPGRAMQLGQTAVGSLRTGVSVAHLAYEQLPLGPSQALQVRPPVENPAAQAPTEGQPGDQAAARPVPAREPAAKDAPAGIK